MGLKIGGDAMGMQRRSWWQKHKRLLMTVTTVMIVLFFALAVYRFGWDWTGFTGYSLPTPQYQRGKTLWDWMQLLLVPVMLAIGGFWLNQIQKERELRTTKQQAELGHELTR